MSFLFPRVLRAALVLFIGAACCVPSLLSQQVSHPAADVTATAKYYSYRHMLSPTQKKELEYILVRASNGEIKTVFNACDVCYSADKGYSQNGTMLRCNNCGNRFPIDGLGNPGTSGTCNPGYLPHSLQGDQVVITVADLLTGLYYFPIESVTGVDTPPVSRGFDVAVRDRRTLSVTLPDEAPRGFQIVSMNGRVLMNAEQASRSVSLDVSRLAAGAYLLVVRQGVSLDTRGFLLY